MNIHTARWQRLRRFVLTRDYYCQGDNPTYHDQRILHRATSVDHIIPRSRGGTDDLNNLRGVCARYNSAKAVAEEGAQAWR